MEANTSVEGVTRGTRGMGSARAVGESLLGRDMEGMEAIIFLIIVVIMVFLLEK